jgi:hypothetical protein
MRISKKFKNLQKMKIASYEMCLRFTVKVAAITRPSLEYCTAIAMFFEKILGVHWNIGLKRYSKTLLSNNFLYLSLCLRIWL